MKKIRDLISNISIVLECRDFRLPLSTRNPKLEQAIGGCPRIIIFTKCDLGSASVTAKCTLRRLYGEHIAFWDKNRLSSTESLLQRLKDEARSLDSLTGLRALVVGMPNVGKSTLLNALRNLGNPGKTSKAAKTGDQAGVTRKIGTTVRVINSEEKGGVGAGVFVLDSPGIFQPFVENGEAMIKVALAHGVKKGLIPDAILADYLLYRMNLRDPRLYSHYCQPTNDLHDFLSAVAKRDGKLKTGGVPNLQESAARILSQWRNGRLGKFILDDLTEEAIRTHEISLAEPLLSLAQAKKASKEERKRSQHRVYVA